MTYIRSALLCAVAASAALPAAQAQEALEEITVTAQKREQSINDVGITINAFTGDTIRELGVQKVEDIAAHTPGLVYNEAGGIGVPVYTIRGIGFDDYSVASNSTVGVYIDEVALPYPVMTRGQLFDTQRVEVLKGPQGDLFGRNTTGGAINYVSNKPTDAFEAGITASYGQYETTGLDAFVSAPFSDNVRGRVAMTYENSNEGWMKSHTRAGESLGRVDTLGIRALLDIDFSDNVNALINVHYNRDQSENAGQARSGRPGPTLNLIEGVVLSQQSGWLQLPLVPSFTFGNAGIAEADAAAPVSPEEPDVGDWNAGITPANDNELVGAAVTLTADFSSATLTSITAVDKFERADLFDWDGTRLSLFEQFSDTEIDSFSQELRLASNGDGAFSWILGAYYSDDEITDVYRAFVGEAVGSNGIFADVDQTTVQNTTTSALFAHAEWAMNDRWQLVTGARFTNEERDIAACARDADGGLAFLFSGLDLIDFDFGGTGDDFFLSSTALNTGDCVTVNLDKASVEVDGNGPGTLVIYGGESELFVNKIETDNFSGKIGLNFYPNDAVLLYANVGTGFKSGGYNGALASSFLQYTPYKEETLGIAELGFKATLADNRMQLNGAAFYYDYEDKQVLSIINDPVFGPLAALVNVPESEVKGFELEGTWLATDALELNFGLAWLDTQVKRYEGFHPLNPGVGVVDFAGAELGQAPKLSANLRAAYTWELGGGSFLRAMADASYSDDYHAGLQYVNPTDNRFDVDSYSLVNARLVYGRDNWEVAGWVRNIGDEYYYHSVQFSNDAITRGIGRGREWGLSFTYLWN